MKTNFKGPLYLLLCSFFWGMCFSAQSDAMRYIEPYTFVFMRSIITCLVLTAAATVLYKKRPQKDDTASISRHLAIGALCGTFLFFATALQQMGITTTTTAKSGFITALYIVIVPFFGFFFHKRPSATVWVGVLLALVGLYFLCMKGTLTVNIGDLLTLACAFVFAIHITLVDRFGGNLNTVLLSASQFGACAIWACAAMFLFETPQISGILASWQSIAFAAIASGVLGYTLQIAGQKYTEPTLASLIMCLESFFAAIGGWLILGETLSGREIFGCVLMLSASVVALLPTKKKA